MDGKQISQGAGLRHLAVYLGILFWLIIGLYLDGRGFAQITSYGQWITNAITAIFFGWIYLTATRKNRKIIRYGVVIALGGEVVFSLLLGMYTYRLGTLPIYVPLGHTIIYMGVYYFSREPLVLAHRDRIIKALYPLMILYALGWLILQNDVLGFLCTVVILLLFKRRQGSRLFFLVMFFVIAYLELLGTYFQAWRWPEIWFGRFSLVPSANPPSAISVFYFAFDAGCLWVYSRLNRDKWQRFRRMRKHMRI
ncbi:hypothetical protein [Profundibacter sp.]